MSHDATSPADTAHGTHAAGHGHGHDDHHAHGIGEYLAVFIALMVLLVATVLVAYVNMGHFNVPVAFLIACIKASLILWFFMHLKQSTRLTQVFAFASFAWLALMVLITLGDYASRNILGRADAETKIRKVDSYSTTSGIARSAVPGSFDHSSHGTGGAKPADQRAE
jgi:cytochrome c oxidase subunit 4